ncbi:hypothetical protein [Oceanidesulfovibrio marinus]|uniref:Lipoprotein n=1 Tax=Oceanidesulfovibrio marinus TaxID=370038 RepID=A0A6P1ZDR1_9BACT|nr:hypothetical protein [Oceanidesulfovibrio marinus]TVM27495.1 hypothetical protein DQK91_22630 [Oceanidesulfovibrio marinus]
MWNKMLLLILIAVSLLGCSTAKRHESKFAGREHGESIKDLPPTIHVDMDSELFAPCIGFSEA